MVQEENHPSKTCFDGTVFQNAIRNLQLIVRTQIQTKVLSRNFFLASRAPLLGLNVRKRALFFASLPRDVSELPPVGYRDKYQTRFFWHSLVEATHHDLTPIRRIIERRVLRSTMRDKFGRKCIIF